MKGIYKNPTTSIILIGEMLKVSNNNTIVFPFNTILRISAYAVRQEKEIKMKRNGKEKIKLSLFTNVWLYV